MTDNLLPDNPGVPIQVMRGGGLSGRSHVAQKGGYTPQDIQILRKYHMGDGQELEELIDEDTKQAFLNQHKKCMKNSGTKTVLNKNCWAVSRVLRELLLRDIRAENSQTDVIRVHVKPQQSVAIHIIADDVEYEELEDDDESPVNRGVGTGNNNSNTDSNNDNQNVNINSNTELYNGLSVASNAESNASDPRRKSSAATDVDVDAAADAALEGEIPDLSGISDEDVNRELARLESEQSSATVIPLPDQSSVPSAAPAPAATIIENPLHAATILAPEAPVPEQVAPPAPEAGQAVIVPNPLQSINATLPAPLAPPTPEAGQTIIVPNPFRAATATVPAPEPAVAPAAEEGQAVVIPNPLQTSRKPNTRFANFFKQQTAKTPRRTLESILPANELRRLNQAYRAMTAKNRNNSAKNNKRIAPPPIPVRKRNNQTRKIVRNPLVNMGIVQPRPAEPINKRNTSTKKASVLNTLRSALKNSKKRSRKNNRRR